jgi:hypothetical protein
LVATRPHVELPIVVLGNPLGNILKPLKTHWEVKRNLMEHDGNFMGTKKFKAT